MGELLNGFQTFAKNVRIVDFLDVAIISLFLYLLINWFRESATRRTIISLLVLFFVYILARLTEMYLTELFIEGLFIFIVIGLVVVFQSDIRRLVDQIGRWRFRKGGELTADISDRVSDMITEAAAQMEGSRTGALIAVKGLEDWDRHINGGIEMAGNLSVPLLVSIFNPAAPGHDGAVLIEGDKILKFSAHLPLSRNLRQLGKGGTRHAAALGLSEQCDALIVVVSEERGTISVAQSGQLSQLDSPAELKHRLLSFEQEQQEAQAGGWSYRWKRINWQTAVASVSLSALLWFTFAYDVDTIYRTFEVPIEYRNLNANNVVLQDSVPIQARVTLSGPEQAFRLLDPSQLVISFNLDTDKLPDDSLVITGQNLNLPSDLTLYDVSPRILRITKPGFTGGVFPVKIPTKGTLPDSLALQSITAAPKTVALFFKKGIDIDSIEVEPVDLSSISRSTTVTKQLVLPDGTSLPRGGNNEVNVHITVEKRTR